MRDSKWYNFLNELKEFPITFFWIFIILLEIAAIVFLLAPRAASDTQMEVKTLPVAELRLVEPVSIVDVGQGTVRTVTAYTSHVEQTDSTPCLGATGANICHLFHQDEMSICAANFVSLGTLLYIEGYGECVVMDRMHSRFTDRVDIYYGLDVTQALEWGIKNVSVVEL